MKAECKKSFVLYVDYKQHLDLIEDAEEYRNLFDAIFHYCATGYEPENLSPIAMMAFSFIKTNIDRDCAKWEETRKKRAEAGRKGGKAKADNAKQEEANLANASNAKHSQANQAVTATGICDCDCDEPILSSPQVTTNNTPYQKIVNIYHEILPELPSVKVLSAKRKSAIKARWLSDKKRQDLEYWRKLFSYIRESSFLMGASGKWKADLDFIFTESKFIGIIEGKYHNDN